MLTGLKEVFEMPFKNHSTLNDGFHQPAVAGNGSGEVEVSLFHLENVQTCYYWDHNYAW